MKNPFLYVAVMLICPSLVLADAVVFEDGSRDELDQVDSASDKKELTYAQVSLRIYNKDITNLEVTQQEVKEKTFTIPFLEKEAEASLPSTDDAVRDYMSAHGRIQNAVRLKEIQPYVSPNYYQKLTEKTQSGIKEQVVLQMVQNMRPSMAQVRDARVSDEAVKITAKGDSYLGPMDGLIQMNKYGEHWIIAEESWFLGDKSVPQNAAVTDVFIATQEDFLQDGQALISFERQIEPAFAIQKRKLYNLRKVHAPKHKNAFTYTFFMESREKTEVSDDGSDVPTQEERKRLHIRWTGPKELVPEQKLYHTKYPLDVSVARDDDGYLPNEFNLSLPERKPNTFLASFLYSF